MIDYRLSAMKTCGKVTYVVRKSNRVVYSGTDPVTFLRNASKELETLGMHMNLMTDHSRLANVAAEEVFSYTY